MRQEQLLDVLATPFEGDFFRTAENLVAYLPVKLFGKLKKHVPCDCLLPEAEAMVRVAASGEHGLELFRPEMGTAALGALKLHSCNQGAAWTCAQFALASFLSGTVRSIDLDFRASQPLCVAGRLLHASEFHLAGADGRLDIFDGDGRTLLRLTENPGVGIGIWSASGDRPLVRAGTLSALQIGSGAWADEWGDAAAQPRPEACEVFRVNVEGAFRLLEQHVPEYYLWCVMSLREIVPKARQDPDRTTSCSYLHRFGAIEICAPATLLETAEMLVHESSHQVYHIASLYSRMDQEDAPEVFSALKNVYRPLERLLLGFHAFANCLLMYARLEDCDAELDRSALGRQSGATVKLVRSLQDQLEPRLHYLSTAGRAIYDRLSERLRSSGALVRKEEAQRPSEVTAQW